MPYTAKVSSPGISVDTNNDGNINGRVHRIKNAGNFNTFTIANGVLTVEGPTGGSAIGGADTQVQFNDGGSSLAGHSGMVYDKTFSTNAGKLTVANLVISGDLTVSGTTTTINTTNVSLADNIIVLNSDATGSASADAGIEIERGDDANVQFMWDESEDSWDFDTYNLASVGRIYAAGSSTPVYSFTSDTNTGIEHAASDAMGLMVNGIRRVHIGVNGMSIVGLDGTTAAGAAGSNQALLVDNISIDDQTIATIGGNKNLILHPHGSGAVELAGVSSNQTALFTTASATNVVGTGVTISAGSPTAGTHNDIAGGSLTLKAGAGKGTGAGGNIVFQTANQAGSGGSGINAHATALTIQDDLSAQFTGNVSIAGGLTVTGTTTSVNTTNTAVADQLLVINDGEAQNGVDNGSGLAGLEVDRGANSGVPNTHAFFVFNESDDTWNARLDTATTGIVAKSLGLGTAGELQITESSDDIIYQNTVSNKQHIFQNNFDGSAGETFLTVGGTIKGINVGNMDIVHTSSDTVMTNKTADKDIIFLTAPFTDATCDTDTSAGSGGFGSNPRVIQMDSTAKLRVGMAVTGTGVSGTIVSVDSATLFTLSADVTATNTNTTLTFIPNSASANFMIDGSTQRVGIGTGTPATNLTVEGTVTLKEQAAAEADTAAYGQLWVKTATPNELYFTTDAGNDIQLTSGTGIAATDTNTQTTYTPSVVDSSDDALIRLTASGAGSGTQDVKLVAGTNITLTPDATTTPHQITIAASGGGGTVDVVSNVATSRILGRVTGSSGDSEELTAAQVRTLINVADGATANTAGIASGNVATFTSGVADNDFLKVAGSVIEGRSAAQTLSDIGGMGVVGGTFTGTVAVDTPAMFKAGRAMVEDVVISGATLTGAITELRAAQAGMILLATTATVGLPDPNATQIGDTYVVINTTGGNVTIERSGLVANGGHGVACTLNGAASNGTLPNNEAVTLICTASSGGGGGIGDIWHGIGL